MSDNLYQFGDKVHHKNRPEWGVGSVVKVEEAIINGEPSQRLSIRFPNAGLKVLIAPKAAGAPGAPGMPGMPGATGAAGGAGGVGGAGAELQRVEADNSAARLNGEAEHAPERGDSRLEEWERLSRSEWLSPLAQRKIRELMTAVPEECTDPFISLGKRLANTFRLYRYDKSGRGLIDWAVAQSGLSDPMTRFTRQELEQLFDRWAGVRDAHLAKLLDSARDDAPIVREALQGAPPAAVQQVRKHVSMMR